jgi:hypothetical protein
MIEALLNQYTPDHPQPPAIMLELLKLVRDYLSFDRVLQVVANLGEVLAHSPYVLEQRALALSKTSRHLDAIGLLEQLIQSHGRTPERQGLLGGRYKKLWSQAEESGQPLDSRRFLTKAIDSYSTGMWLDLNEYYCASNLPRLLRTRGSDKDADLAMLAADITRRACERGQRVGKVDEWLAPTLLAAAFDAGDADHAGRLLGQVMDDGPAAWHVESVLADARTSLALLDVSDERDLTRLRAVLNQLEALVNKPSPSTIT